MKIKNDNGLLVNEQTGHLIGYLFDFTGQGIFSPDGKVDITKEEMEKHNSLLAQAEIAGLDKAEIGQWGTFYYINKQVQTFTGVVVSSNIHLSPSQKIIKFIYHGKQFRGQRQQDSDCFNFKRIS